MLFTQEHYGKPISEALSKYLKRFTNTEDRVKASSIGGISTSTVRDVVYRYIAVTEQSSKAIIELMKIAIQNRKNNVEYDNNLVKELEQETGLTL